MSEITYRQEGDYLIPNIALEDTSEEPIRRYGRLRRAFLQEHRPIEWSRMVLRGDPFVHLREIDRQAEELFDRLVAQMAKAEGVTEQLKAQDQMEWVGRMNNIRSRAEEIVLREIVYN